jgi:hypothetical protein
MSVYDNIIVSITAAFETSADLDEYNNLVTSSATGESVAAGLGSLCHISF